MRDNYYYKLNQSHKNLDNEEYIKKTTEIMNTIYKQQDKKEALLIMGAGNLSDVDLDFFLSSFKTIYLTDIDVQSTKQALGDRLNHPQIEVKQIDYIGIEETDFYDNFDELLNYREYREVVQFFEEKMERLRAYHLSDKFNRSFDSIYISPIYTQLFYREVETKLESLLGKSLSREYKSKILAILFQSMVDIIDRFNKSVVDLVAGKGTVIVASDVFFLSQGSFSETVYKAISDYERMEKILSKYQDEYGFGLGDYGLYSLSQKVNTINEKWLLWGKTKNSAYAVKFCVMSNHKVYFEK